MGSFHATGASSVTDSLKWSIRLQIGNINKPTGYNATSSGLQDIPKNLIYSGQASCYSVNTGCMSVGLQGMERK